MDLVGDLKQSTLHLGITLCSADKVLADEHFPGAQVSGVLLANLNTGSPAVLCNAFQLKEARRIWNNIQISALCQSYVKRHTPNTGIY